MKYFEKPLSQHSYLIQLKSNPGFQFPFPAQASRCSALLDPQLDLTYSWGQKSSWLLE